jgi:anti-anti-sigma factor
MNAKVTVSQDPSQPTLGAVTVVHLSGRLDVESAAAFSEGCMRGLINRRVVFDFRQMGFVGSTGLLTFLETLQKFATVNTESCKFSAVGSEFQKLFAATPLQTIPVYETAELATTAYLHPDRVVPCVSSMPFAPVAVAHSATAVPSNHDLSNSPQAPAQAGASSFGYLNLRHQDEI